MINITDNMATATPDVEANTSSNMTDDVACYLTSDPQVIHSYKIYLVATILFVATGLIGNTLSFLVFSSKAMIRFSSNVYLLILAVSDSFFLVSVFLSKVLTTLRCLYFPDFSFDVVNRSSVICKVLQYCNDLFSDYSTCLILGFTVERYAAAYLPIAFKRKCTNRRARIACAVTFVFIAFSIAPYHALFMGRHIDYNVCTVLVNHEEQFVVLYIVEVALFRIVPVIAIAVLNVFIIAKVSRITRQRIRIASNEWRGAKCSEPDQMRLSGLRLAQTGSRKSEVDGTTVTVVDGIQSKEDERKGVCLTDSAEAIQIEVLGRIRLIQPTPFELELPRRMTSCKSEIDIPDNADHLNIQDSDLPESRCQSEKSRASQSRQIESAQPERISTPDPEDCNLDELERFDSDQLEALEYNQPEPERPENCQKELVEPEWSESRASTLSKQNHPSCLTRTRSSQPDTEFTEAKRLTSEFDQPVRQGTEPTQPGRLETAEQQPLESIEPKANSTNGHCEECTRHVISLTRGKKTGRKEEKKTGRNRNGRNEIVEEKKNGRTDGGRLQERRKDSRRDAQRDDRSLQMTVTLILVSTIHVIVFLPVLVHFVVWKLERSKVVSVSPAAMQIAQNYTRVLYVAGFAVNFFLYTVSGRMFREQLRTVLWRRRSSSRSGS